MIRDRDRMARHHQASLDADRKAKRAELAPQIDQGRDQLAHWRRVRADQIASGLVADS